ncbi:heavy-metal-associated domain-containing protein [Hymenobacter sp. BT559]|jgi:copper chaperone CopZ|uniref:heavy-metal-associated domain-containing protein n=1 Tax=Hymenobacter sp. BT559 TaxID=2795729 RepID=UPI0018ECE0E4|nr:heavy metal-associated domain-containing protein [Hymenobacter sp. BT559]MBJ6142766.1 heavy-metal-associated domain-containing protein [Hymenobacter sp. BT559]
MATQRFKTTINCANCLRAITPTLNAEPAITAWQVDTTTPDKLLTVTTELPAAQVVALVEEAGFEAQPLA